MCLFLAWCIYTVPVSITNWNQIVPIGLWHTGEHSMVWAGFMLCCSWLLIVISPLRATINPSLPWRLPTTTKPSWQGAPMVSSVSLLWIYSWLQQSACSYPRSSFNPLRCCKNLCHDVAEVTLWLLQFSLTSHLEGKWNGATGDNDVITGSGHVNQVQDLVICDDMLVSCGIDDMVIFTPLSSMQHGWGFHSTLLSAAS